MIHQGTVKIETTRLILRRFTMEDAQPMFQNWASDPKVTVFLRWPTHTDIGTTQKVLADWIKQYEKKDFYQWAIVLKPDGNRLVGVISVVGANDDLGILHIGYCIGSRWWRQGIASEALSGNQYEYQLEIFHDTDLVPVQHMQKIESIDNLQNAILLEEKEVRLQRIQQFMFIYSNIKAKNYPTKNGSSTCYTYITEFQINYSEKCICPEFKLNMHIISNKKDKKLISYSLSKLLYNIYYNKI